MRMRARKPGAEKVTSWAPMESFIESWKTFREHANESETIASCLRNWTLWKYQQDNRVADIGCGDGRMLEAIILKTAGPNVKILCTLLDPTRSFIEEAKQTARRLSNVTAVTTLHGSLRKHFRRLPDSLDIAFFIHTACVVTPKEWDLVLSLAFRGTTVIWVMDNPTSVFTHCWSITAPTFYDRLQEAYEFLSKAAKDEALKIEIAKRTVLASNPFSFPKDVRDNILSLICYADFRRLRDFEKKTIQRLIKNRLSHDRLPCDISLFKIGANTRR